MTEIQPRVLLVGCGEHAAETLVPALASLGRASLVGVCDLRVDRAANISQRFHVPSIGISAFEMLDELLPDAAILAGPPSMHVDVAMHAFGVGTHVLVEKPPACTTDDLRKMIAAADAGGRVGMVAHNLRYTVAWQRAMELIAGTSVESVTVEYHASGPISTRWGLPSRDAFLLSHAVHVFDLLSLVLGRPASTSHHLRPVGNGRFVLTTQWRAGNGVVGTAVVSTCAPRFDWNVQFVTGGGSLVRILSPSEVVLQGPRSPSRGIWEAGRREAWRPRMLDAGFESSGYGAELTRFFDCIAGTEIAAPGLSDEVAVYLVLDEVHRQARSQASSE